MEVHTLVQEALSELQPSQPAAITQRLVDAAVHRAVGPWTRKQEMERALQAGMNKLSWNIRYGSEHAGLKQRAWDAAVAAVRQVREEASYHEMETAAMQAVQPMIREYEHHQACQRIVGRVYITLDGKFPIDPSGVLPDGKTFRGADELKIVLRQQREIFAEGLTEKLLTYALGRGLDRSDQPAVKQIVTRMAADDYKFSSLLLGIVDSAPFQMQREGVAK